MIRMYQYVANMPEDIRILWDEYPEKFKTPGMTARRGDLIWLESGWKVIRSSFVVSGYNYIIDGDSDE